MLLFFCCLFATQTKQQSNFFLLQIDIVVACDLAIIAQCDIITIDNIKHIRQYYHLLLLFLLLLCN